jgi:hypothetical protein
LDFFVVIGVLRGEYPLYVVHNSQYLTPFMICSVMGLMEGVSWQEKAAGTVNIVGIRLAGFGYQYNPHRYCV